MSSAEQVKEVPKEKAPREQTSKILLLKSAATVFRPLLPLIVAVVIFEFYFADSIGLEEIARNAVRAGYWSTLYLISNFKSKKGHYDNKEQKLELVYWKGIRSSSLVGAGMSAYYVYEDYI